MRSNNDVIECKIKYDAQIMCSGTRSGGKISTDLGSAGKRLQASNTTIAEYNRLINDPTYEVDEYFGYIQPIAHKHVYKNILVTCDIHPTYDSSIKLYSDGKYVNVCITHVWYINNIKSVYKICKTLLDNLDYDWIFGLDHVKPLFTYRIRLHDAQTSIVSISEGDNDYDEHIPYQIVWSGYKKYMINKRRLCMQNALCVLPDVLVCIVMSYRYKYF